MSKRLTERQALAVTGKVSEPLDGVIGGSLLFKRSAKGITAYLRLQAGGEDKTTALGPMQKGRLASLRQEARSLVAEIEAAGGTISQWRAAVAMREMQARQQGTVAELIEDYLQDLEAKGRRTVKDIRRILTREVIEAAPHIAQLKASEVTPAHVKHLLEQMLKAPPRGRGKWQKANGAASNGKRTAVERTRAYIRAAFQFGLSAEYAVAGTVSGRSYGLVSNPAAVVPVVAGSRNANTEALSPEQMGELLRIIDGYGAHRRAIALLPIYLGGQRLAQMADATWSDLKDGRLHLMDSKGTKAEAWEHVLPVDGLAHEAINDLMPLSDRILAITPGGRMHPKTWTGLYSVALANGETATYRRVRATCETLLAAIGVSQETRAWLLSHGRSGVQAKHYDRNAYMPEKQAALAKWHVYLERLRAGQPVDNVVLLARRDAR